MRSRRLGLCQFDIAAPSRKVCNRVFIRGRTTLLATLAVTDALMAIGLEAGYPDLANSISNRIKGSAIKHAKKINRGWGKWEIAMFIISTARLLANKEKVTEKVDMRAMIAFDKVYEVALKQLNERNLDHDCIVTKV